MALPRALDPAGVIAETNGRLRDVYFDYDQSELRGEALSAVENTGKGKGRDCD